MDKNITIIGGGNMGMAFARGLTHTNQYKITISDPNINESQFPKNTPLLSSKDNKIAVKDADVIVLAIKPQHTKEVIEEIKRYIKKDVLLISIVAGVSLKQLQTLGSIKIVRAMPNLCAQISQSISVWTKNTLLNSSDEETVREILSTIGTESELEHEIDINKATAISGSGPAYLFYLAECMMAEAEKLGLPKAISEKLVKETLLGSANILKENQSSPTQLRSNVTSRGGTTESAFKTFEKMKLGEILSKGIQAAAKRASDLSDS